MIADLTRLVRDLSTLAPGRAWVVGGALRDAWLGRAVQDVDLAVAGDARALARRFARAHGGRAFPLDEDRDTHRVVRPGGATFDFAALQGSDLAEDLARRDFTLNAMALPPSRWGDPQWKKHLIDPQGGRADLRARRVRAVTAAALREDPLRCVRAYRLAVQLGFHVTPETARAVRRERAGLRRSAPERVREELLKLLASDRAAAGLSAMEEAGLLEVIFPEVGPMRRTGRDFYGPGGVLAHCLAAVASLERLLEDLGHLFPRFHRPLRRHLCEPVGPFPRLAYLKLAAFFHDAGKPATARRVPAAERRKATIHGKAAGAFQFHGHETVGARLVERMAERLRFSGTERRSLARQVAGHMRPGSLAHLPALTDRAIYRFYRDMGGDAVSLLVTALADHFTYLSPRARRSRRDRVYLTVREMLGRFFLKRDKIEPPKLVDGHRIMRALGLKPGPEVGRLLALIREAQSAGEVGTVEEALALARASRTPLTEE